MPSADLTGPGPPGQWIHAQLFGQSVPAGSQLSLGEGSTPLEPAEELGRVLGIPSLWLKREDHSPTGSHKARCLGYLCSTLLAEGISQAVISSSGNAATAAAAFASLGGIRLLSLVSPRTPRVKLQALLRYPQPVVLSRHPVGLLHHAVRSWGLADLRASVNPLAPTAYRGIAAELIQDGPPAAVFHFSSSGATALGLSQGFAQLLAPSQRPQLHVVESAPGGELTRSWYPGGQSESAPVSPVGELGTRRSRLAPRVRRAVGQSGGRGWRVTEAELAEVLDLARSHRVETSWEGVATLAAMRQAANRPELKRAGRWVALLTGAAAQLDLEPSGEEELALVRAETPAELDLVLVARGFKRPAAG
jgi:threonine synthase